MTSLDFQEEQIKAFTNHFKKVSVDTIKASRGFMLLDSWKISNLPKLYREKRFGLVYANRISILGRFCFPVMESSGRAMGLVAYDPFVKPKYYDTPTYGYKASKYTLFGMEKMKQYYETKEPVFITEGLGCMLFLRDRGFNSLALLGSHMTSYVIEIIKRLYYPIIVPDSDSAGNKMRVQAMRNGFQTLTVPIELGKDLDDARNVDEDAILKLLNQRRWKL